MNDDDTEEMLRLIDETACLLRGMTMDPRIPADAKEAMRSRIETLETFLGLHCD